MGDVANGYPRINYSTKRDSLLMLGKKIPPHFSGEKVRRFLEIWIGYGNIKSNSNELRTFVIH
jgi:hypothetical protein